MTLRTLPPLQSPGAPVEPLHPVAAVVRQPPGQVFLDASPCSWVPVPAVLAACCCWHPAATVPGRAVSYTGMYCLGTPIAPNMSLQMISCAATAVAVWSFTKSRQSAAR